jgi:hypothetical protein
LVHLVPIIRALVIRHHEPEQHIVS